MLKRNPPAPLFYPVLLWSLGIILGRMLGATVWVWLALALALAVGALAFKRLNLWLVLMLCLAMGGLRWEAAQRPSALDAVFELQNHIQQNAVFQVRKLLSRQAGVYEINLVSLAGKELSERLLLTSDVKLDIGQSYSALIEILPGKRDPVLDTYPARHRAYIRQNLKAIAGKRALIPIAKWREKLLENLDKKLGADANFAKALLFSDTSSKGEYRSQLNRSGMLHLIVVSGLHIWFIYYMVMVLLNAFLPRRLAEFFFLVLITFYAALNHWSPPVLRSILMIGFLLYSRWRSIPLSGAQLLALSLLAVTAISPGELFNIGLQLSFICVGVIILGLPKVTWIKEQRLPNDRIRGWLNRFFDLMVLNVAVSFSLMPVTLFYFGTASLNGIAGNTLGVPLTGAILLNCLLILFLPAGNFISAAYVNACHALLRFFEFWTELVSRLPFYLENIWLNHWQLLGCGAVVLAGLICLRRLKLDVKLLPLALIGLALVFVPFARLGKDGGIYLFDCGTADCILIWLPGGTSIMVDTGPLYRDAEQSWASRKLLPWAQKNGLVRLDWLVLTHLDSDHSGGFTDLARSLKPSNIVVSNETARDSLWLSWQEDVPPHARIVCISDTVSFQAGPARLKFLHPDRDYYSETVNGNSLVFRLDYAGKRYLFTGDADLEAEAHLVSSYPSELAADFLKAGHHGSRTSSSRDFVQAVQPDEVWITASSRNRWGFPHPEPLANFRQYGARIRSTATGTIRQPLPEK